MKKIIILSFLCVISIIGLIITIKNESNNTKFEKPKFDENAIEGIPIVSDDLSYQELNIQDGYVVSLCGNVKKDKDNIILFFTSNIENNVYLKLRIFKDEKNIGETGLIKPGEYIKNIKISEELNSGEEIIIKIMSYDPDTYYSMGVVNLNTIIK